MALCEKTKIRPPSKVTMKIQWIPYTYADHETGHAGDKKHKHHKCAAEALYKYARLLYRMGPQVAAFGFPVLMRSNGEALVKSGRRASVYHGSCSLRL